MFRSHIKNSLFSLLIALGMWGWMRSKNIYAMFNCASCVRMDAFNKKHIQRTCVEDPSNKGRVRAAFVEFHCPRERLQLIEWMCVRYWTMKRITIVKWASFEKIFECSTPIKGDLQPAEVMRLNVCECQCDTPSPFYYHTLSLSLVCNYVSFSSPKRESLYSDSVLSNAHSHKSQSKMECAIS
jgi:hypothetical protein